MIQTNDVNHNSWPFGKNGVPSTAAGGLIRFSKTYFQSREFSVSGFSVDGSPWDTSSLKEKEVIRNCALVSSPPPTPLEIITLNWMINIYSEAVLFLYRLHIYLT